MASNTLKRVTLGLIASISIAQANTIKTPPNILFIVMDDVGIDQMQIFGYGGVNPPQLPNINSLALSGIRFKNAWSMPSCTPSRATFFNGRFPLRTNVFNAITSNDLANSQLSPYEVTVPKLLKQKGYVSSLVGKMHLSGSEVNPATNPFGNNAYKALGWDHFDGYLDGGPYSIDTTAGGVAPEGTYGCGFVPSKTDNAETGADSGACYLADNSCSVISTDTTASPGRTCMEKGGILDPNQSCQTSIPSHINFSKQNGYYTGSWVINQRDGSTQTQLPSTPEARGYRTKLEANKTIAWINQQKSSGKPWMASLGFSAVHDPLQNVPSDLLPANAENTNGYNCTDLEQQRVLVKQMLEGMDHEIGRVLLETGLASYNNQGAIDFNPEANNTMVIVIGDNGTWVSSVRAPFDPTRAKGSPYQTGVWVPLIVAGPLVKEPGREVEHMVNGADLYQLFAEIADIDVNKAVPKSHQLDATSMMPYLKNPQHGPIRSMNYTQMGTNLRATSTPSYPCVVKSLNSCTVIFPQQSVCQDQGGDWYGPNGVAGAEGLSSCCAVNSYLTEKGQQATDILPINQTAIRNKNYKLVEFERENCDANNGNVITNELYKINENTPVPSLDREQSNLLDTGSKSKQDHRNYKLLQGELKKLRNSVVACPGDGNLDKVVDEKDMIGWLKFRNLNDAQSSWFDFNLDGLTDEDDATIIEQNFGKRCPSKKAH